MLWGITQGAPEQHDLTAAMVRSEYIPTSGGGGDSAAGVTAAQFQALMQRMGQLEQSQATKDQKIKDLEARLADKEDDSDAQQGAVKVTIEDTILALQPAQGNLALTPRCRIRGGYLRSRQALMHLEFQLPWLISIANCAK